jgi:hypothetical protein
MNIPTDKQVQFLEWQVEEQEALFLKYLNTEMNQLFTNKTAFVGRVWGVDTKRGTLIIQFKRGFGPRLNYPYSGFLNNKEVKAADADSWSFTYQFFREHYVAGQTDMTSLFYLKNDDQEFVYIGFRDVENTFYNKMKSLTEQEKHPYIILAETDPPIKYLLNLKHFIQNNPDNDILNLNIQNSLNDWNPEKFESSTNKKAHINTLLQEKKEVIIQGPPGTGKSTLVAEIADSFLATGKTVCITSLANKALMEVAEKSSLAEWLEKGKVHKTNLTANEVKILKDLEASESLTVPDGHLLLSTYYKLSSWYSPEGPPAPQDPIYDLLVIEEASQCFIATIAAFKRLGRQVLIVGDPMQLPPIVLSEHKAHEIHPNIMLFAKGLESYAPNVQSPSYILHETYRLSAAAAKQTGSFYRGRLVSKQLSTLALIADFPYANWLQPDLSAELLLLPIADQGDQPQNAIDIAVSMVLNLREKNPVINIALLAPFKKTVLAMQERIGTRISDYNGLTIETIDRIQGLTADITIYLMALNNPGFAMQVNRFNVATSRAKSGTLIITDSRYPMFAGIDPRVTTFLNACKKIEIGS